MTDPQTDDRAAVEVQPALPQPERNWLYSFMRALIVFVEKIYFRLEVHGAENTPRSGGVLLVSNHASNVDPFTVACRLPRKVHFLAKQELMRGALGWVLRRTNSHPINRSGVDRLALQMCIDLIRRGHVLLMFPEGTRTRDGRLQEAKAGTSMIAMQSEAWILPAYIDGSLRAMPPGAKFPRPAKIRVFVGEPFQWNDGVDVSLPKREQYHALGSKMMACIAKLEQQAKYIK
jgi:1-acyl-sn-glycerol-3-phosphate acyltransferase